MENKKNVIKVDIVYPGNIESSIGPSKIIKRINNSKDLFTSNNIILNVFLKKKKINKSAFKISALNKDNINNNAFLYTLKNELVILLFTLKYILKNNSSDIVIFDHLSSFYFYSLFSLKRKKIILFQHNDGNPFSMSEVKFPSLKNSALFSFYKKQLIKKFKDVTLFVFIAKYGKKNFSRLYPKYSNNSIVIPNGIPDKENHKIYNPGNLINLICVGTVSYRKGQNIIINSLHNLASESLLKYHLTIVGDGPQLQEFKLLTRELNIDKNVTFTGNLNENEVNEFLLASDVFILMSNSEGLPLSILEAIRFGLPVITTDIAGCPEPVSNLNGFVISPDSKELSSVLHSLNVDQLKVMSKKSRQLFEEEYKFESFLQKYIEMIKNIK